MASQGLLDVISAHSVSHFMARPRHNQEWMDSAPPVGKMNRYHAGERQNVAAAVSVFFPLIPDSFGQL